MKMRFVRSIIEPATLAAVTLSVFWGALDNPFHFDDSLFLESPQVSIGDPLGLIKPTQTRPLTYLTFYWNYRLGGMNPAGYHLVNLLLHVGNVIAVYFITGLLLGRRPGGEAYSSRWLPAAAAGIFALHPVQCEVVNYAYQRSTLLAAFFSLAAMILALLSGNMRKRRLVPVAAAVLWLLAVGGKESALVLPLLWPAYLWVYSRDLRSFREAVLRSRSLHILTGILVLSGAGWVFYTFRRGGAFVPEWHLQDSLHYFASQVQVFAVYLRLLVWPSGLSVDHDVALAPFASFYSLFCLILLGVSLGLIFFARRKNPTPAFLGLAFFILLAPTSSIVPSADLLFEHRLYLPMLAFSMLAAWGILSLAGMLFEGDRLRQTAVLMMLIPLFTAYSIASRERTYVWGDNVRLWEDAVAKAPGKPRVHYNLGIAYLDRNIERAEKELRQTVELDPDHAAALYNLGWIDQTRGRYDSARKYYLGAIRAQPAQWQAYQNLGNISVFQGLLPEAVQAFEQVIRIHPQYWPAYLSLASLQLKGGRPRECLATLKRMAKLKPDALEAAYLSAHALIELEEFSEAEKELRILSERDSAGAYKERIRRLRETIASQRR